MQKIGACLLFLAITLVLPAQNPEDNRFQPIDIFDLEYVSDPRISPDGEQVAYVRNFKDIMTDRNLSNLWVVNFDGSDNQPLTTGNRADRSPRWSPDGTKMLYLSDKDGKTQVYLRWLSNGAEAKISNTSKTPRNITWSPDGRWIAFSMAVDAAPGSMVKGADKPKGAKWADDPVYVDKIKYRSDGVGMLPNSYQHLFILSADGGHPQQLTAGEANYGGSFCWANDSKSIIFSANLHEEAAYDPLNSEIHEVDIATRNITTLTSRQGPDQSPRISPDGNWIAYTGFDDQLLGYQQSQLYVMKRDGSESRLISEKLDRDIENINWAADGKGVYFQYDDEGHTKIALITLDGKVEDLAGEVGGLSIGRPYSGGTYTVAGNGRYAFTLSQPDHPADLAVGKKGMTSNRLTAVNDDLFSYKQLGDVEEIWYESSFDGRKIQGWICKPPDFDPTKKYPLMLEIHGGPFTNYGWRFSAEVQLYAAKGYVVLYTNPRGSTSYGADFGNLIHHNYPGEDYHDLMSGVDAVIEKGYIDEDNLYITGGSGGGVLTAWTIGQTDRFKAAVVAKPVINWYSFVLHADNIAFFSKYWFPDFPWNAQEHYMKRSPISLVGNVKTPTMLLTGEEDYRTPMSETEQYYAALKLRKVPTSMVRIQGAGHGIANKPSNLIAKVNYITSWFDKYRKP